MLNNNLEINGLISNFDEDVKRIPEQEFINSLNLNKKSPYYKKRLEIIKSFNNDEVRRDHYEELGMTFYKISARMDINKYKNKHKKEDIIEDILALPIKPYLFRFCRNCGLYALRSGPFRVCEARGGITTLSALYVLLKRRTAACQSG